jgi:hypothetical protein
MILRISFYQEYLARRGKQDDQIGDSDTENEAMHESLANIQFPFMSAE